MIAKTSKLNYVKITHWGVKEVSKSGSSEKSDTALIVKKEAARLVVETKQFLTPLEEFSFDASDANFH